MIVNREFHRRRAPLMCGLLALAALAEPAAAARLAAIAGSTTLVTFDSASPGTIRNTINVSGLMAGESLVALDLRPLNDVLYAVTSAQRVVIIESCSGVAIPTGLSFAPALAGSVIGLDFNPTVDRLRIVTDAEENFRFNPVTAVPVDADAGLGGVQYDTPLSPAGTPVAAAYDRNDNDPTTPTTLFVLDSAADELRRQGGIDGSPSPNLGALTTIGPLGVDANTAAGFEIVGANQAFAMLNVGGFSRLYSIDLGSGAATLIGSVGANGLTGLAAIPPRGLFADGFELLP
jgi:hypothetical protein